VTAVEFAPEVPELRAPAELLDRLLTSVPGDPVGDGRGELEAAGVLSGDRLHPRLELVRAAVDATQVELLIERGDRAGRGWLGPAGGALVHPLPDGRARLVALPPALLVDALVRLNDVGPRPRPAPAERISLTAGALAEALATRTAPGEPALQAILASLREHWRVTARWEPADGALGVRGVEVLDTDGGYWLVVPDSPTVELWPTTPTEVYRALCQVVPLRAEVAEQ
jgi:hypothetical protein